MDAAFISSFAGIQVSTNNKAKAVSSKPSVSAAGATSLDMMRHGCRVKKLGLPADQRKALLRGLTTELIRYGRITTTLPRAKEVKKTADKMIQLAKRNDLHARRQALAYVYDKDLVAALFEGVPERYAGREGGYTRVLRTMPRKGDNAPMGIVELV